MARCRRRSLRRAVALDCAIVSEHGNLTARLWTTDVSHEGLWLEADHSFVAGEELVLAVTPPGARPWADVWAAAEVVRTAPEAGFGLAFTYLSALDRRYLARSLVGIPPRLPRRPPPLPGISPEGATLRFAPRALSSLLTG